jgi:hypothetical protein
MSSMHTMPTGGNRPRCLPLAVWGNPLARHTDRLEASIVIALTVLWLLTLPIFAVAGSVVWSAASTAAQQQQYARTRTTAQLTENAPTFTVSSQGIPIGEQVLVGARWMAPGRFGPDRHDHRRGALRAGDQLPIWVDPSGVVTDPPTDPTTAGLLVGVGTALAWLIWGAALATAAVGHRHLLYRRRLEQWAQD